MLPNLLPMLVSLLVCLDDPAQKPVPAPPPMVEITMRVVDADKKPVAGASVRVQSSPQIGVVRLAQVTGADGIVVVTVRKDSTSISCRVAADGYAAQNRRWAEADLRRELPTDFTFPLRRGVSIGGRVLDAQGRPLAGVGVGVRCDEVVQDLPDGILYDDSLLGVGTIKTDEYGTWSLDTVPHGIVKVSLRFVHPDFVSDDIYGGLQKAQSVTLAQLKRKEAVVRMDSGAVVTGTVRDATGKPIVGAVVVFHEQPRVFDNKAVATDAQGRYRIPALPAGKHPITVAASGCCPTLREIVVTPGLTVEDFRLAPGNTIRVKVTDAKGRPVAATLSVEAWKLRQTLYNGRAAGLPTMGIPAKADAEGVYVWTGAPAEPVTFNISAKDMVSQRIDLTAGPFERTIVLKSIPNLSGKVTDAKTGRPIEDFRVIPIIQLGFRQSAIFRSENTSVRGKAGAYQYTLTVPDCDYRVLVEAEGYRSQLSPPSLVKNEVRVADFALEPASPVTGRIVGTDGKPLAGVGMSLGNPFQTILMVGGKRSEPPTVTTDAQGRFRISAQPEAFVLVVNHDSGYLVRQCRALDADLGDLKLEPWASVRGTLRRNGRPVGLHPVRLGHMTSEASAGKWVALYQDTTTDENGHYEFRRVFPGPLYLEVRPDRDAKTEVVSSERVPFPVVPAQAVVVDLGGGTRVEGKVRVAGEGKPDPKEKKFQIYLVRKTPDLVFAADSGIDSFDLVKEPPTALLHIDGHSSRQYWVYSDTTGAYWLPDVPAGDYWIAAEAFRLVGRQQSRLGVKFASLTITAEQAAGEKVAVPDIEVPLLPPSEVGETLPAIDAKGLDGKPISVAGYKGKYVLMHPWAGWPRRGESIYPLLVKLRADLPADKVAFLGLNLDGDPVKARARGKEYGLNWPHVDFGSAPREADKWRVVSVGPLTILDPDGKLVLTSWDFEEVEAFLRSKLGK